MHIMRRPKYIALAAMTLDGKIATREGEFTGWTSKEDKTHLHRVLDASDVVLVGNTTYKTAKKPLAKRNCIVLTRHVPRTARIAQGLFYCDPRKTNIKTFIKNSGYRTIAILGGTQTYTFCLEHGMLDEIHLTVEPIVFGKGLPMFEGKKAGLKKFKLISAKKLNAQGSMLFKFKRS